MKFVIVNQLDTMINAELNPGGALSLQAIMSCERTSNGAPRDI